MPDSFSLEPVSQINAVVSVSFDCVMCVCVCVTGDLK